MANQGIKITSANAVSAQILQSILEELRLLRSEVMLLLPQDDLEDYAHPKRVQGSYQRAVKKYPPLWK